MNPERQSRVQLLLVNLQDGMQNDPDVHAAAHRAGFELRSCRDAWLAHTLRNRRLFYLFYTSARSAHDGFVIQRIRKTDTSWAQLDAAPTRRRVSYQVEVFKTAHGELKQPDRHFGSYRLRDGEARREITKQFEIGRGRIPDHDTDGTWPFSARRLYELLQTYSDRPGVFNQVDFVDSVTWELTASFDAIKHRIRCRELGLDAP